MNKILTPIVITTAATFIVSCGSSENSENAGHQKTTWRISSRDFTYIVNDETTVRKDASHYDYDNDNELIRLRELAIYPSTADQTNKSPTSDGASFSSGELTGEQLQWPPGEAYQVITEITSISPSHWLEESYSIEISNLEIEPVELPRFRTEYMDWGDTRYIWGVIGDWSGLDSHDAAAEFVLDREEALLSGQETEFSFPYLTWEENNIAQENSQSLAEIIPTESGNLLSEQHVIREYNNLSYLTYRAVYSADQTKLWSEDILEYTNGVTLNKMTTHNYHLASDFTEIRRFTFTSANMLQIEISSEVNGELLNYGIETANYEQAPCGPITSERSKKAIPRDFPVCIEK